MKKLIILLSIAMLLVAGCSFFQKEDVQPEVAEEPLDEVVEEEVLEEVVEEKVEEPIVEEFKASLEKGFTAFDKEITLVSLKQGPEIVIAVDGTSAQFVETKSEEIVEDLRISVLELNYDENYVKLDVQPLELGENEYLMEDNDVVTIGDKEVKMVDVRSDNAIHVEVSPSSGSWEKILVGNSKTLEGIEIFPLEAFLKDKTRKPYAIVKIVPPADTETL